MLRRFILPVSILLLVSCGNEEPEASEDEGGSDIAEVTEESPAEGSDDEEQTEEENEAETKVRSGEESDEDFDGSSEENSEADSAEEENLDEKDLGSSSDSLADAFEDNQEDGSGSESGQSSGEDESINEVFEASEPNDNLVFEDMLTAPDNVDNYMMDSRVYLEIYDQGQAADQNYVGITSEVSEGGSLKIASDMIDQNLNVLEPYGYTNADNGELLLYENGSWVDYSNEFEPEELVYGLYSEIDAAIRSMADRFETREHEAYNVLYYQGNDDEVYQMFEEMFDLEMNDVNLEERRMEVLVYTHKETGEITLMDFLAAAPVTGTPEQNLLIEVILSYYDYGSYPSEDIREPS